MRFYWAHWQFDADECIFNSHFSIDECDELQSREEHLEKRWMRFTTPLHNLWNSNALYTHGNREIHSPSFRFIPMRNCYEMRIHYVTAFHCSFCVKNVKKKKKSFQFFQIYKTQEKNKSINLIQKFSSATKNWLITATFRSSLDSVSLLMNSW